MKNQLVSQDRHLFGWFFLTIWLGVCTSIAPSFSQESPESKWRVECTDTSKCQLKQSIIINDQTVARLLVYKVDGADVLEFLVPLGVSLLRTPKIIIDKKKPVDTNMLSCSVKGCIGFVKMGDSLRTALFRGLELKLVVDNSSNGQQFVFTFDLIGFTKAYKLYDK